MNPEIGGPRPSWPALLAFGLGTRVAVVLVGCLIFRSSQPVAPGVDSERDRHHIAALADQAPWIEAWYRWDAIWYAEISENGYCSRQGEQSPVAFMPLLPLLMAAGASLGLDRYWVGLILPNLAFTLGFACFGKIVHRVTGNITTTWRACILLAAFPWSFFFSAPYQESLSFALISVAILAWIEHRPARAGFASALASSARLGSVAFSGAILLEWADDVIRRRPARHHAWPVAFAGAIGFGLFFAYLSWRFGDPLLHLKSHEAWGRKPPGLGNLLKSALSLFLGFRGSESITDYFAMCFFLALGVRAWRVRGPFWGALILIPVIQGMATGTIMSMSRIVLTAFPAFLDTAELFQSRFLFRAYVVVCLIMQIYMIKIYVTWDFVG